jgi:hypothetical protein
MKEMESLRKAGLWPMPLTATLTERGAATDGRAETSIFGWLRITGTYLGPSFGLPYAWPKKGVDNGGFRRDSGGLGLRRSGCGI